MMKRPKSQPNYRFDAVIPPDPNDTHSIIRYRLIKQGKKVQYLVCALNKLSRLVLEGRVSGHIPPDVKARLKLEKRKPRSDKGIERRKVTKTYVKRTAVVEKPIDNPNKKYRLPEVFQVPWVVEKQEG